ncbi:hypothetical protein VIOLETTEMAD_26 [Bacillus phage VioletteMad]|uniref:Uncharacterized protein n=1 Tax=Bacillus phage VioletteMad TaxID=2023952 RepID=A0A514AAN1_9CAUD|nr:hypothetical protein VIOLETTEMAD_26 [Bacillus phage VioletteMad]
MKLKIKCKMVFECTSTCEFKWIEIIF